ncbi:MAG: ABC transporter permease [Acidobacteriota bacterium]
MQFDSRTFTRHQREWSVAAASVGLLVLVAVFAPAFFSLANLRDLILSNAPVLVVAIGMTLIILAGQIDISVGSQFAIASVLAGLLSKFGLPVPLLAILVACIGALMGALNGVLVAKFGIPAIVVTLATMISLRDGLRWATEGKWVQGLPDNFQWFGLDQSTGQVVLVILVALTLVVFGWGLGNLAVGRAIYATGSDHEAARLCGINPTGVVFGVFVVGGALTALAGLLNSIRFADIQGNAGVGLEMKAIAAVVVGGTSINGGRGTLIGTLLGVALLGTIGTALTFLGISPFWEKAIQGAIILVAVVLDVALGRTEERGEGLLVRHS